MRLKDTSTKDSYATNETVEYICRVGYRRNFMSSMTAVCNANNSWTPLQEVCIKKLCSSPGDPLNGYVTMTNGTLEFGSQVDFTCEDGYHLIGRKTLYCEVIGDSVGWSDNPPICDRVKCVPPPNIENGIYRTSGKDVYEYNEVVNYECNSLSGPDQYSLIGNKVLYCTGNGEWSSKPPVCKVVKCDYPVIRNGDRVVGLGSRFTYKSQVVFQCHQGYVMKGSNTIICEENSTWVPPVPTCIKELPPPTTQPPILSHSVSTTPLSTLHNTTSPFLSPAAFLNSGRPLCSKGAPRPLRSEETEAASLGTTQPGSGSPKRPEGDARCAAAADADSTAAASRVCELSPPARPRFPRSTPGAAPPSDGVAHCMLASRKICRSGPTDLEIPRIRPYGDKDPKGG
ncbi:membrane cofactor protein [Orycteropus afer afer]|uniref:Membrane cofactor protein n=1 Tax=Orycteropus afer afer TaxID=1230840 RepID=A0A8B7B002_ORYAF|nr:membrane cofactor protein [Orycteropus afer afer]